jgi:Icc-related predicted phosphoesterase
MTFMRLIKPIFIITLIVLAASLLFCSIKNADEFRFVFMTDIHVQPELNGLEGFKQAITAVNTLSPKPDFIITGGDLIMDALEQSYARADSLYTLFLEACKNFSMPVYHGIGNHELFGVFEESGVEPDHPQYAKKMFKQRIGQGKTYRSFNYKGWHFILLDDIGITKERRYIGEIDQEQIEWLSDDLEQIDKNSPIAVVLHIPMFTFFKQIEKSAIEPNPPTSALTNSKEVFEIFKESKLLLVLQGHAHIVEELISRNTHFITGGSVCGEWWKGSHQGFPEGFVVVDVQGDNFTWHYQTYGWQSK